MDLQPGWMARSPCRLTAGTLQLLFGLVLLSSLPQKTCLHTACSIQASRQGSVQRAFPDSSEYQLGQLGCAKHTEYQHCCSGHLALVESHVFPIAIAPTITANIRGCEHYACNAFQPQGEAGEVFLQAGFATLTQSAFTLHLHHPLLALTARAAGVLATFTGSTRTPGKPQLLLPLDKYSAGRTLLQPPGLSLGFGVLLARCGEWELPSGDFGVRFFFTLGVGRSPSACAHDAAHASSGCPSSGWHMYVLPKGLGSAFAFTALSVPSHAYDLNMPCPCGRMSLVEQGGRKASKTPLCSSSLLAASAQALAWRWQVGPAGLAPANATNSVPALLVQAAGSLWGLVARRWLALPEQLRALSYIRPRTCNEQVLWCAEDAAGRQIPVCWVTSSGLGVGFSPWVGAKRLKPREAVRHAGLEHEGHSLTRFVALCTGSRNRHLTLCSTAGASVRPASDSGTCAGGVASVISSGLGVCRSARVTTQRLKPREAVQHADHWHAGHWKMRYAAWCSRHCNRCYPTWSNAGASLRLASDTGRSAGGVTSETSSVLEVGCSTWSRTPRLKPCEAVWHADQSDAGHWMQQLAWCVQRHAHCLVTPPYAAGPAILSTLMVCIGLAVKLSPRRRLMDAHTIKHFRAGHGPNSVGGSVSRRSSSHALRAVVLWSMLHSAYATSKPRVAGVAPPAGAEPNTGSAKQADRVTSVGISYKPSVKRSFNRAARRAFLSGGTWYKGRWRPSDFFSSARIAEKAAVQAAPARPTATVTRQVHGFRVLTYNAGGITTAVWDELMIYLPSRADIVVLTESHWELDREFQVADWHVMHAGLSRRQAGVMVLLKRNLFHAEQIKHSVLVSGRLLHVRLTLATEVLDILACYQHAWNGYLETEAKQQLLNQRASFWTHLSMALRNMPRRNRLLVMGDFNARCTPFDGLVGPGTLHRFHDEHRDDNEFQHLLQANRLCVLNTWGRRAATYESDTARSQIDFILQPAYQVRSVSKHCTVHTACPVAAWRGGGRHFPVSTVVPASRGRPPWVKGEQGLSTKDGQRIAEWLKANRTSEAAQRFENSVSQELGLLTEYDPKQVNTILLREGAKLLPRRAATGTSIAGSLRGSITDMWLWYKQSRTRQSPNPLQDCLRRWAARAKFQSMHRAVQAAGRRKRRERYAGILRDAEVAVQSGKPAALLQVIKRLSPKIPKRRWQLRSEGQLLGPQAAIEAVSTFWRQIYQAPALESTETAVQLSVEERDIRDALARLPSGKAVPAHYAPSVLWRLAAGPLAALAHRAITGCWSAGVSVPAVWQAAWISFLPKSAAIPRSPGDLRPIGLLDPLGKAVLSHLKRLIHPTVARHLREVPQYAYLPLRSTHQAIARVAAHCRKGRSLATAPRPKLVLRHRGLPPRRCSGAIQLSVDLRKAFDSLDRGKLFQCLVRAGVDDSLAHTVLQWHQQVSYYIRLDGHESHFLTGKGVRQGCPIAPTIWIAFLDLMVDLLKGRLGSGGGEWIRNNLTCFADDMHAGLLVHSEEDLNRSLEELGALLSAVEALGLEINPAKSAVLLRLGGDRAAKLRRRLLVRHEDRDCLELRWGQRRWFIPLVKEHRYLGVCIGYHRFEDATADWRVTQARANYQRVRHILNSRRHLSLNRRVSAWRAIVWPSLKYGVAATGLTKRGLCRMKGVMMRQIRAMANSPVHLTGESNDKLLRRLHLDDVLTCLLREQEQTVTRNSTLAQTLLHTDMRVHPTVLEQDDWSLSLLQGLARATVPDGSEEALSACPDCGRVFFSQHAMHQHSATMHGRKKAPIRGTDWHKPDRSTLGYQGLPICVHCKHEFSSWQSLLTHILHQSCAECKQPLQRGESSYVPPPSIGLMLRREGLDSLLKFESVRAHLVQHCGICGQWVARRHNVKTHVRLTHNTVWQEHLQRAQLLVAATHGQLCDPHGNCRFCGAEAVANRYAHAWQCSVMFQAAFLACLSEGSEPEGDLTSVGILTTPSKLLEPGGVPTAEDAALLKQKCCLCGMAVPPKQIKNHLRKHHVLAWETHTAIASTDQLRVVPSKPCAYCKAGGFTISKGAHRQQCSVLFQWCLLRAIQEHGVAGSTDRKFLSGHISGLGFSPAEGPGGRATNQVAAEGQQRQQGQGQGRLLEGLQARMAAESNTRRARASAGDGALAVEARRSASHVRDGPVLGPTLRHFWPQHPGSLLESRGGLATATEIRPGEVDRIVTDNAVRMHASRVEKSPPQDGSGFRAPSRDAGGGVLSESSLDVPEVECGEVRSGDCERGTGSDAVAIDSGLGQVTGLSDQGVSRPSVPRHTTPCGKLPESGPGLSAHIDSTSTTRGGIASSHGQAGGVRSPTIDRDKTPAGAHGPPTGGGAAIQAHVTPRQQQQGERMARLLRLRLINRSSVCYQNALVAALLWQVLYQPELLQQWGDVNVVVRRMLLEPGPFDLMAVGVPGLATTS